MIFVTGPLYAGKKEYIQDLLGWDAQAFAENAVWDVQELVTGEKSVEDLVRELLVYQVVIATEVGGGVVPVDSKERKMREDAGRLSCLLAAQADTVIRVCCGLPQILKGALP